MRWWSTQPELQDGVYCHAEAINDDIDVTSQQELMIKADNKAPDAHDACKPSILHLHSSILHKALGAQQLLEGVSASYSEAGLQSCII